MMERLLRYMDAQLRKRFNELKVTGQRFAISAEEKRKKDIALISYLKSVLDNELVTEFEDVGFCYWNISDNYALLKDGHALYNNHNQFLNHLNNQEDTKYLFWLVCDATQRLTLQKDGYGNFWWNVYQNAVESNVNNDLFFSEFIAHRAALYYNDSFVVSQDQLVFAKSRFEKLLEKAKFSDEYDFYKIVYLSLVSKYSNEDHSKELCKRCENLFVYLNCPQTTNDYLVGEWKSFVTPFDKKKQGIVGISSAINSLIFCNRIKEAKELYYDACAFGLPQNHYIEKRLMAQ